MNNGIPCWNCDGEMKCYGHDTFYWYYKCPVCGKQRAILKEHEFIFPACIKEIMREWDNAKKR